MLNQSDIIDLQIGSRIEHFFILTKIELKTTRTNKAYLDLSLRDKTTSLSAKLWDNFSEIQSNAKENTIIKIAGILEDFNGQKQIKISKIRLSNNTDNVTVDDFLPKSLRNFNEMQNELSDVISSIQNNYLKLLLKSLFSGEKYNKYIRVPAGKAWHHAYIHGLLEHTLEIIKLCDLMCKFHPQIDRDLLICGAILHDYGKTEELKDDASFDYTDKGKLIGHIVIAATEIEITAKSIENFPEDLKNKLIHLVLSHQGKLEYATPVEPKMLEAIVLYQADELSAKTNAYAQAIKSDKNNESGWTRYLPLAGTSLLIPQDNQNGVNSFKKSLFD